MPPHPLLTNALKNHTLATTHLAHIKTYLFDLHAYYATDSHPFTTREGLEILIEDAKALLREAEEYVEVAEKQVEEAERWVENVDEKGEVEVVIVDLPVRMEGLAL